MTCSTCETPKPQACGNPQNALTIVNEGAPVLFHKVVYPASMGDDETGVIPEELQYRNVLLEFESNGHAYLYSSDGIPTFISYLPTNVDELEQKLAELGIKLDTSVEALTEGQTQLEGKIDTVRQMAIAEEVARQSADENLQSQIDAINDKSDVVDVVGTYAELSTYDTSKLGDNDIVKVLNDETHDNAITYYRWSKGSNQWLYVGETGPYYTKAEVDNLDNGMRHDIENLTELIKEGAITTAEREKLNSILEIKSLNDSLELDENGQLSVVGGGSDVSLLSEYSSAPSDEEAYNANYLNKKLFSESIHIGLPRDDARHPGERSIAIGANLGDSIEDDAIALGSYVSVQSKNGSIGIGNYTNLFPRSQYSVGLGYYTVCEDLYNVAIGSEAHSSGENSVALGHFSTNTGRSHEVSIGREDMVDGVQFRYLANVKDGELDHDAVNLKQMQDYVEEHSGGGSAITLYNDQFTDDPDGAMSASFLRRAFAPTWEEGDNILIGDANPLAGRLNEARQSVVITQNARTYATGQTLVGSRLVANGMYATAMGNQANAEGANSNYYNYEGVGAAFGSFANVPTTTVGEGDERKPVFPVAIGHASKASARDEVSFGNPDILYPNKWDYGFPGESGVRDRFLANVRAGELDTDATNLAQVKDLIAQAGGGGSITPLQVYTASPKEDDVYSAGYTNSRLNNTVVKIGNGSSTSTRFTDDYSVVVGDGASVSPTYTGTTASQAIAIGKGASVADSSSVANTISIAIGYEAKTTSSGAIALGRSANVAGEGAVALGRSASSPANLRYSVALGGYSKTSRSSEVSIGSGTTSSDYGTRYLANVRDGVLDQDAVTVHQLNEAVGNINTLLETLISGEGAK